MVGLGSLKFAASYLAVIQFFFFTTWTVYVVFLGELLEKVGIGREYLLLFIVLDQLIFAITDTLMGYAADKVEAVMGLIGPWLVGINLLSCLAFALLPATTLLPDMLAPAVFTGLIVIWIATSSVLRAPPMVLLMKHAAKAQTPWLAAMSLFGLALGGAAAPYLGTWLKGLDPLLPFFLSAATLALTVMGLVWIQKLKRLDTGVEGTVYVDKPLAIRRLFWLLVVALTAAIGFQLHFFLHSKGLYLQFAPAEQLAWLMPVFWIGFNLLVFPGAALANRLGALTVMKIALLLGAIAVMLSHFAPSLEWLIVSQLLAGGAWGVVFMAGMTAALNAGSLGREGTFLGAWFSMLAIAGLLRALFVLTDGQNRFAVSDYLPTLLWLFAFTTLIIGQRYLLNEENPA